MEDNLYLVQSPQRNLSNTRERAAFRGAKEEVIEYQGPGGNASRPHFIQLFCNLWGQTLAAPKLSQEGHWRLASNQESLGGSVAPTMFYAEFSMRKIGERARKSQLILSGVILMLILLLIIGAGGSFYLPGNNPGPLSDFYHTSDYGISPLSISRVVWSPDSRYLACGTSNGSIDVLDLKERIKVLTYAGQHGAITNMIWLPDGKDILSVSLDHTIRLWNAFTGQVMFSATDVSPLRAAALADGKYIAWGGDSASVSIWNLQTQVHTFITMSLRRTYSIRGLALSPDGQLLVVGDSSGAIRLWNMLDEQNIYTYAGDGQPIDDLALSSDGKYGAVLSSDGFLSVWDLSCWNITCMRRFKVVGVQALSWEPGRLRLALAYRDGSVRIFDMLTEEYDFVYQHHAGVVEAIAWSPNGSWVASGDASGAVEVWNVPQFGM